MKFKILERDIKKAIRQYLNLIPNSYFFPIMLGAIGNRTNPSAGVSDILGLVNGKFVAIEVKRPGGVLSEKQKEFLANVERAGGIAIVAYSLEDVRRSLDDKI